MESPPSFDDGRPPFNHGFARELIGKHILVGVTYLNADGSLFDHRQFHGDVVKSDPQYGICLLLRGEREGEYHWLPPDTRNFEKARPGEYKLRSTGEIVEDPDYLSTWTHSSADREKHEANEPDR